MALRLERDRGGRLIRELGRLLRRARSAIETSERRAIGTDHHPAIEPWQPPATDLAVELSLDRRAPCWVRGHPLEPETVPIELGPFAFKAPLERPVA